MTLRDFQPTFCDECGVFIGAMVDQHGEYALVCGCSSVDDGIHDLDGEEAEWLDSRRGVDGEEANMSDRERHDECPKCGTVGISGWILGHHYCPDCDHTFGDSGDVICEGRYIDNRGFDS